MPNLCLICLPQTPSSLIYLLRILSPISERFFEANVEKEQKRAKCLVYLIFVRMFSFQMDVLSRVNLCSTLFSAMNLWVRSNFICIGLMDELKYSKPFTIYKIRGKLWNQYETQLTQTLKTLTPPLNVTLHS